MANPPWPTVRQLMRELFEASWRGPSPERLARFLPDPADAEHAAALEDLIALDMERARREATPERPSRPLEDYLRLWGDRLPPDSHERLGAIAADHPSPPAPSAPQTPNPAPRIPNPDPRTPRPAPRAPHSEPRAPIPDPPFPLPQPRAPDSDSRVDDSSATHAAPSSLLMPRLDAEGRPFPERLGRYQLLRELGRGGMGAVYLAHDTQLDRPVAIKIPRLPAASTAEYVRRFYREARSAAALRHPHICSVFDVGEIDGVHHLVMAYIEGRSLAEWLVESGPPAPQQTARWVAQAAEALDAAHRLGIVHRDLKPANIMIDAEQRAVIMDFGLARRSDQNDSLLTLTGAMLGTPAYMAPEVVRNEGDPGAAAVDIYGLGVVLYELLTGERPFTGTSTQVLAAIATESAPPPSRRRADIPPPLERICLRALRRRPEDRYASMREFARDLQAFLASPGTPAAAADDLESDVLWRAERLFQQWGWGRAVTLVRETAEELREGPERELWLAVNSWLKDERSVPRDVARRWRESPLDAWRRLGGAFESLRRREFGACERRLAQADHAARADDTVLQASLAHCRGALLHHQGATHEALRQLHASLELVGREHFLGGRILDTLGKTYAAAHNFLAARDFLQQAIQAKRRQDDQPGLAVTHGQFGRLYLDWGELDEAEQHFRADLELAEQLGDDRAVALMYNHLGQIYLARGYPDEALGYLEESLQLDIDHGYRLEEAYARKDRARAQLASGRPELAASDLELAEATFQERGFAEGLAHVWRVRAALLAERGEVRQAELALRDAARHFDQSGEITEAARTWLELAGVLRRRPAPPRLVADALLKALERAERSGRDALIREIEQELQRVDHAELQRRVLRRARGVDVAADTSSLREGVGETCAVVQLELLGTEPLLRGDHPAEALGTINQLFRELSPVLDRHRVTTIQFQADGFLALARGPHHARRAAAAALELIATLDEFNRPRRVLGLPEFTAGIGVAVGEVVIGNVGTYRKVDFTVLGRPVRLAALLRSQPRAVRVCDRTRDQVRDLFECDPAGPQSVVLDGEPERIWRLLRETSRS